MLDQLMQMVRQNAQQTVVDNPNVPNQHNEEVMQEAGKSVFSGLQNMLANGGTEQITALFNNDNNPEAINNISGNFIDSITQKFGIDKSTAMNIAATLIPQVLSALKNKTNDPNNSSIDFGNVLSSLKGGDYSSTINSIGGKFGLDKDNDGDVDLSDITKMFGR